MHKKPLHKPAKAFAISLKYMKIPGKTIRIRRDIFPIRYFTKTVSGVNKRYISLECRFTITVGIANINCAFAAILLHKKPDCHTLLQSSVAPARISRKVFSKTAEFQKRFNISPLAVAYNKQPVIFGKLLQRFHPAPPQSPSRDC